MELKNIKKYIVRKLYDFCGIISRLLYKLQNKLDRVRYDILEYNYIDDVVSELDDYKIINFDEMRILINCNLLNIKEDSIEFNDLIKNEFYGHCYIGFGDGKEFSRKWCYNKESFQMAMKNRFDYITHIIIVKCKL